MTVEVFVSRAREYTQARRFSRIPVDFPVQLMTSELRLADRVLDVSEGGIRIATEAPVAPMTLVTLSLDLPHQKRAVDVLGRVMWSTPRSMGVRFEQVDGRLVDSIDRLRRELQAI